MANISIYYPSLIHVHKYADNGFFPAIGLHANLTAAENHITAYRKKELFRGGEVLGVRTAAASGTTNLWRFRCRTGYGTSKMTITLVQGKPAAAGMDPYVRVSATLVGGATTNLDFHTGISVGTPTDAPNEWIIQNGQIDVTAGSAYEVLIAAVDYARPIAISVYEEGADFDDAIKYYADIDVAAGSPILDVNHQRWSEGLMRMLRQNCALQLNWGGTFDGTARTRTSATLINLVDNSATGTPTSTTEGYRLDSTYRKTISRSTIPVEFCAYGSISAGSGIVKWVDTAATVHATVTINSATPQWFTTTGTLPAGTPKLDVQYAGDGAHTVNVYAVSAYQWEDE